MELIMKKRLFRPDEVAQILCLSRRTIYRMIRDGRLPAVRLGAGPWRIPRETLLTLLPQPQGDFRRFAPECRRVFQPPPASPY
ncbi:MAG: helix-turn-helix domain-containing protein [Desulfobaccales bacterium]